MKLSIASPASDPSTSLAPETNQPAAVSHKKCYVALGVAVLAIALFCWYKKRH